MRLRYIAALLVVTAAASAYESPGKATFHLLFDGDIHRAQRSGDASQSAILAGQIRTAALAFSGNDDFTTAACEAIYRLGSRHPSGFEYAAAAMRLLSEIDPQKRLYSLERIAQLRRSQYGLAASHDQPGAARLLVEALLELSYAQQEARAFGAAAVSARQALTLANAQQMPQAGEIGQLTRRLGVAELIARREAHLHAKLTANPRDAQTRTALIMLYVVEWDNPAAAAELLSEQIEPDLRYSVLLASHHPQVLDQASCRVMASWYRGLADRGSAVAHEQMLARARQYEGCMQAARARPGSPVGVVGW